MRMFDLLRRDPTEDTSYRDDFFVPMETAGPSKVANNFTHHAKHDAVNVCCPLIDVIEQSESFSIYIEIPGIDSNDIALSFVGGYLSLKGEKKDPTADQTGRFIRHESSCGLFNRTLELPLTADCDKAEAFYKDGVVRILIPKKKNDFKHPSRIEIKKS